MMAIGVTTAAWLGASALVSGVSSNRQKRIQNEHLKAVNARRDISIDTQIGIQEEAASRQAAEMAEVLQRNELRIEQQAAAQAANATVSAAAAGVAGQSADMTQAAIDFNAGTQQGALFRESESQTRQLNDQIRSMRVAGELSKHVMDIDESPTGQGLATLIQGLARANLGFSIGS